MGLWIQRDATGSAVPAAADRVALILLGEQRAEDHCSLLLPPIPAVDGVIFQSGIRPQQLPVPCQKIKRSLTVREVVSGRLPPLARPYEHGVWLRPGERLLAGNDVGSLRVTAQKTRSSCLMPVHYPMDHGLTLIALEPRWVKLGGLGAAPATAPGYLSLPIDSQSPPPAEVPAPRENLAWAVLYRAVQALASGDWQTGFAVLEHLYGQTIQRSRPIAGLVVRNGMAAALAAGLDRWGGPWFERGAREFSGYAEVRLLQALMPIFMARPADAVAAITRLLDDPPPPDSFLLSGQGETTYRALTFRGQAFAAQGMLDRAVQDWAVAFQTNPDYLRPLQLIARHPLHQTVLDRLGLKRAARGRPPQVTTLVAEAYARAGQLGARRGGEGADRINVSGPPVVVAGSAPGVIWEGPFFTESSLARVNRELALRLIQRGWDLGAVPTEPNGYDPSRDEAFHPLAQRLWHRPERPAVTVRHCWPPLLHPAGTERTVYILPWEYGGVPVHWLPSLEQAAEIWVYSEWIRLGLIRSGLHPDRIQVVPCGVDPQWFRPDGERIPPGSFRFLYVGGTIFRKGYDLALQAFLEEFESNEPAILTFKDFGSGSFYRDGTGIGLLRAAEAATAGRMRRVEVQDAHLSDAELARLYRSADVLLAPFRAEGFCLPAVEAMACGTPPILSKYGPALDYAQPDWALLVEGQTVSLGARLEGMELAAEALIFQVSLSELRRTMRWAYQNRGALKEMGRQASRAIHSRFTWDSAVSVLERRLQALVTVGPVPSGTV